MAEPVLVRQELRRQELRRHDLVDPDPVAWTQLLASRPDLAGLAYLAAWAEDGRPLVVRRYHPGEPRDRVPLGLPLPPSEGKHRIGLSLPPDAVRCREPPLLRDLRGMAPASWGDTLDALVALAERCGVTCRPFGALLWQAVTGFAYLTPSSDIDLLWSEPAEAAPLLDGIARIAESSPMRIDGEVLLADGAGIHWREWHEAPPGGTVLVKNLDRVEMRRMSLPA